MEFIWNKKESHSKKLSPFVEQADEIFLATAFLKQSGTQIFTTSIYN
jgi:hypothetical protein